MHYLVWLCTEPCEVDSPLSPFDKEIKFSVYNYPVDSELKCWPPNPRDQVRRARTMAELKCFRSDFLPCDKDFNKWIQPSHKKQIPMSFQVFQLKNLILVSTAIPNTLGIGKILLFLPAISQNILWATFVSIPFKTVRKSPWENCLGTEDLLIHQPWDWLMDYSLIWLRKCLTGTEWGLPNLTTFL